MKYWVLDIWAAKYLSQNEFDENIAKLETNEYDAIILFCQYEYAITIRGYDLIIDIAKKKNIKIYLVLGSRFDPRYHYTSAGNIEIITWTTIFFRQIHQLISVVGPQYNTFVKNLDDLNYRYHFIFLNNKVHKHRYLLMDTIAKFDLLKYSAYSWHNECGKDEPFKFIYYDGKQKILDEQFTNKDKRIQCYVPTEYYQSFFQVISESTNEVIFITEKTVTALILGKPFIIAGAKGIHQQLKDWGFKLYDELFDYSFDSMEYCEEKYNAICENIRKITNLSLDECRQLHSQLQDKILYNRKRAIEIAYDQNYVPELAKYVFEHLSKTEKRNIKTMLNEKTCLQNIKEIIYKEILNNP